MSRKIDRSDLSKVSQDDLRYLASRGALTLEEKEAYLEGYDPRGNVPVFGPHGGLIDPSVASQPAEDVKTPKRVEGDQTHGDINDSAGTPVPGSEDDEDEDGEEDDDVNEESEYSEFTVEELKTELDNRGIEYKSNARKPELVALLDADDEEDEG